MNNLKGFYLENKQLVMLTASVIAGIFVIFAVIAVIISRGSGPAEKNKNAGNSDKTWEISETKDMSETRDIADNSTDDETASTEPESPGLQEETETEEGATEPETIDPNTLPYKIRVNRAANCITVYGKDEEGKFTVPVKAITCSTGKELGDTPLGEFSTLIHYNWLLMVDGSYGQYAYRFYRSILFHSVPYYSQDKGNLEWEQYNLLGEPASLGCVRVCVADAIWLIENCEIGTAVEVYDDAANPGPLGKPETIKIPENSPYRGWDPTDPDPNNPWHTCSPKITVKKSSVQVKVGASKAELLGQLGAEGYDTCGNKVTEKIEITGIRLDMAGTYGSVKLKLTDAIGKSAKEVTVSVKVGTEPSTEKKTEKPTGSTGNTEKETTKDGEETTEPVTEKETETGEEETTTEAEENTESGSGEESDEQNASGETEETGPDTATSDNRQAEVNINNTGEEGGAN